MKGAVMGVDKKAKVRAKSKSAREAYEPPTGGRSLKLGKRYSSVTELVREMCSPEVAAAFDEHVNARRIANESS